MLPNLKYFQIIFQNLGLFSSFKKLISQEKSGNHDKKFEFGFGNKMAPSMIPKLDFGFDPFLIQRPNFGRILGHSSLSEGLSDAKTSRKFEVPQWTFEII